MGGREACAVGDDEHKVVETRYKVITGDEFRENPALFEHVTRLFRDKNWYALVGEWPLGAVLATVIPPEEGGGIKFFWKHDAPEA